MKSTEARRTFSVMIAILTAVAIVFGITWLVLLVDCIRRREFGGPLGSTATDKTFWVLTFVLFDPLLLGLYLLFVKLRWAWAAAWRPVVFILALAAVLVLRTSPLGEVPSDRLVAERGPDGRIDATTLEDARQRAFGGALQTHLQRTQSSSSRGTHAGVGLCARSIRVEILDGDPALRLAALELGIALTRLPFVDRVDCALDGAPDLDEGPGPDLTVVLDLDPETDLGLLVVNRYVGALHVAMSRTPWASDTMVARGDDRARVARIETEGSMQIDSWRAGFAFGTARHEARSGAMADWLVETVAGELEEFAADVGVLPAMPASWSGEFHPLEAVGEVAAEAGGTLVHASSGLLCDSHAVWSVELGDDVEGAIGRVRGAFESRGFEVWRRSAEGQAPIFEARREGARVRTRVHVSPARFPMRLFGVILVEEGAGVPRRFRSRYVVDVSDDFSDARMQELAAAALRDEGAPVELALALEAFLPADGRERLIERFGELRRPAAVLAAARIARDAGRVDSAAELLRRGYLIARVRGSETSPLESLADDLGVELPENDAPLDPELLSELGFERIVFGEEVVRPLRFGDPVEVVVGVEEPAIVRITLRDATVEYALRLLGGGQIAGEVSVAELELDELQRTMGYDSTWLLLRVSGDAAERCVHFRVERDR